MAAIALAATSPRPACAAHVDHIRGIILGTTLTSLDIGTPSRDDIHLEMSAEPFVAIAEPSETGAIHLGAFVSVVTTGAPNAARARSVVIVPDTAHVFETGRFAWDLPGAKTMLVNGRVTSVDGTAPKLSLTIGVRGMSLRVNVSERTPVILLRPGSRIALLSPHAAFVFGRPPTGGLSDSVQSVIVGDGTLALPF